MAYTDLPGRALQNDLNLLVQRGGDAKKYLGNADLPNGLLQPDNDNNLELVRLQNAAAGVYYIQIMASNVLRGPVPFALYVAGEGLSSFGPY
jgi:serine protease AprX